MDFPHYIIHIFDYGGDSILETYLYPEGTSWTSNLTLIFRTFERVETTFKSIPVAQEVCNIEYPKLYRIVCAPWVVLVSVTHPEIIKQVYDEVKYDRGTFISGFLKKKDNLFFSNGLIWKDKRNMCDSVFYIEMLNQYIKPINRTAKIMLLKWRQHCEDSEYFNSSPDISALALDSFFQSSFSLEGSILEREGFSLEDYISALNTVQDSVMYRIKNPLLYVDFIYNCTSNGKRFHSATNYLYKMNMQFIQERREEIRKYGETYKKDLGTILLTTPKSDGSLLSDEEVESEVSLFVFGGQETTSSSLGWVIYNLGKYPELQEKCREEIQSVLSKF